MEKHTPNLVEENNFYLLPEVLTQKKMPVTTDNIATAADVKRWPHLSKIHIPSVKANVDMLIGTMPKLLEPWEIVNSCGGGPYAIRTVLGWVINAPFNGNGNAVDLELPSVVVNRISVSNLEIDKQFQTFMANRITAIREVSNPSQWRHISSKDNPADAASRGMKVPVFLNNSGWLEG